MKSSDKKVGMIISLIVIAMIGLVTIQAVLLNSAMSQKEQAFSRNVMAALNQVATRLATTEALSQVISISLTDDSLAGFSTSAIIFADTLKTKMVVGRSNFHYEYLAGDTNKLFKDSRREVFININNDSIPQLDPIEMLSEHTILSGIRGGQPGRWQSFNHGDSTGAIVKVGLFTDSLTFNPKNDSARWHMVTTLVDRLSIAEKLPIEMRLDSINVDSIITTSLEEFGIDLDCDYGIITSMDDSLRVTNSRNKSEKIKNSEFKANLFPFDLLSDHTILSLFFPNRQSHLFGQIVPMMAATTLLMFIITGCFVYTIRTILRQRRFAGRMTDFINNMTHEFKTPISTIALAAEAIKREDVLAQQKDVLHFNEMILSENQRMRSQTEKILEMAVLEEDDQELQFTEIDLHQLLQKAVDAVSLQVNSLSGKIDLNLEATKHLLFADKVHLSNIIRNILDNAIKYSKDSPQIKVFTFDSNFGVGFRISDSGIGLTPEDCKRVFDKYYRVSSGNRHDVKGFGLGLTYVRLIVQAHGGRININSKIGEGTELEIVLPVNKSKEING